MEFRSKYSGDIENQVAYTQRNYNNTASCLPSENQSKYSGSPVLDAVQRVKGVKRRGRGQIDAYFSTGLVFFCGIVFFKPFQILFEPLHVDFQFLGSVL